MESGEGSEIVRKCLEELKKKWRRGKVGSGWEDERKEYFEKRGESVEVAGERGEREVIQRAGGDRNRQTKKRETGENKGIKI